jgi:flagellar hook-associated protein 3 FlgL
MSFNSVRVTHRSVAEMALANLQRNLSRVGDLQDQVSSLKRIRTPSDDPVGAVSALKFRSQVGRHEQIDRNLDDAAAWLGTIDAALQRVLEHLNRARDLGIQGRNASLGVPEREALADEVDQLRQGVLNLANAKYLDRPVFAGNARTDAAYDLAGAYLGDDGTVERSIAPGQRLAVNATGNAVFGPAGATLFDALTALSASLRTDPTQIDAAVADLDTATQRVLGELADVGARARRVEDMKSRNALTTDGLKSSLSEVEDVDITKALIDLNVQQTAYQAALAATARAIQPSLVDFLR